MTITGTESTNETNGGTNAAMAVPEELIDAVVANADAGGMELLAPTGCWLS